MKYDNETNNIIPYDVYKSISTVQYILRVTYQAMAL